MEAWSWLLVGAVGLTLALLLADELRLRQRRRRHPQAHARAAHERLRIDWFDAVSRQPGTEILAVQTLRNAMMAATLTASTAALALMGGLTLGAPALTRAASFAELPGALRGALVLVIVGLLFGSLLCSAMSLRAFSHASFVAGLPVGSPERGRWRPLALQHLRRAGRLYGQGLRLLLLVAPVLAAIVHPLAGPPVALGTLWLLRSFDVVPPASGEG